MWDSDENFLEWLDEEDLGTDDKPLDDHTLQLMYRAWVAGIEFATSEEDD